MKLIHAIQWRIDAYLILPLLVWLDCIERPIDDRREH